MLLLAALVAVSCNAHPRYAVQPVVTRERVERRGAAYVAFAHIGFTLRTIATALVPSGDPALRQHAYGHLIVARRAVSSSDGDVQANGATASQARARLQQTISRMESDLQSELLREERAYDDVTANGAQQSQGPLYGFPGGADAHAPCGQ